MKKVIIQNISQICESNFTTDLLSARNLVTTLQVALLFRVLHLFSKVFLNMLHLA